MIYKCVQNFKSLLPEYHSFYSRSPRRRPVPLQHLDRRQSRDRCVCTICVMIPLNDCGRKFYISSYEYSNWSAFFANAYTRAYCYATAAGRTHHNAYASTYAGADSDHDTQHQHCSCQLGLWFSWRCYHLRRHLELGCFGGDFVAGDIPRRFDLQRWHQRVGHFVGDFDAWYVQSCECVQRRHRRVGHRGSNQLLGHVLHPASL